MDKKKLLNQRSSDDLKGFEDFLEGVSDSPTPEKNSKSIGGESLTFLLNDNTRLNKVAQLVADKLPMANQFSQSDKIIEHQRNLNIQLKNQLFTLLGQPNSSLQLCLGDIWNNFFNNKD